MEKYLKYKSLSWWAAIAEAAINVMRVYGVEIPKEVDGFILALFGVGIRGAITDTKPKRR